jgi:hypothetical protein
MLGWHEKGLRDDDTRLAAINAQMALDKSAQDAIEARAKIAEKSLAKQKALTYDISNQWAKEKTAKSHVNCKLSAATISILRSATMPTSDNSR